LRVSEGKEDSSAMPAKAVGLQPGRGGVTGGGETRSSLHQAASSRGCAFGLAAACGVKGDGERLAARRLRRP
jgi:hypothetical protein